MTYRNRSKHKQKQSELSSVKTKGKGVSIRVVRQRSRRSHSGLKHGKRNESQEQDSGELSHRHWKVKEKKLEMEETGKAEKGKRGAEFGASFSVGINRRGGRKKKVGNNRVLSLICLRVSMASIWTVSWHMRRPRQSRCFGNIIQTAQVL